MSMELRTDDVPYITLISRNDPWLEKVHNDMAGSSWAPYIAHLLEKCCLSTLEYTPQMQMEIPNQTQLFSWFQETRTVLLSYSV